jgi:hypothetical protein
MRKTIAITKSPVFSHNRGVEIFNQPEVQKAYDENHFLTMSVTRE